MPIKIIIFCFVNFYFISVSLCQPTFNHTYTLADSLCRLGKSEKATPLLRDLMSQPISDSLKAEVWMRYAYCLQSSNNTDSAVTYYKQSAAYWENNFNKIKLGRAYANIGIIYQLKKNYNESMNYFQNYLRNADLMADSVRAYIGICVLHLKQKHYLEAYSIIINRLNHYPEDIDPDLPYYKNQGLGLYFKNVKQYDAALLYLQKALHSTEDNQYKAPILNDIAETYQGMKNYRLAFVYQDSSSMLNKLDSAAENLQFDYDTYAGLYEETGNFKKALYYAKLGRQLSDSFYDVEKNNAMIDAEARYQNQKTLAAKAIVEKDNIVKQRNFLLTLIALGLVAILAFFSIRNTRIKQKANRLLTQQKQQVQQLADELSIANQTKARLFSTIGHDLRSPISSLYASLKMQELRGGNGNEEMSSQTVRLLDTLEELLIWSKSQMDGFVLQPVRVNVYDLFEELKEFYAPAALAENISIVNEAKFNDNIHTDEHLLKTILRNALSNAIVNTASGSSVYLTAHIGTDGLVSLSVQNPCTTEAFQKFKTGFEEAAVKSSAHGYGMVLMKEFAQKINAAVQLSYSAGNVIFKLLF